MKNWDYSSEAIYFITLVAQNRKCIFGAIDEDKMILNNNGKIIETELLQSITIRERWFFYNWIIMTNHIHLLVETKKEDSIPSLETHRTASLQFGNQIITIISSEIIIHSMPYIIT